MSKIKITTSNISDISEERMSGPLDKVIEYLIEENNKIKSAGYTNPIIYFEGYESISVNIQAERLETDKEYEARLNRERKQKEEQKRYKEAKERSERSLLRRLKKKYEKRS
jgi:hypothetical protein